MIQMTHMLFAIQTNLTINNIIWDELGYVTDCNLGLGEFFSGYFVLVNMIRVFSDRKGLILTYNRIKYSKPYCS